MRFSCRARKAGSMPCSSAGNATIRNPHYYALKILTGQAGGSNFLNVVPIVEDGKVEEKMDGYWPVLYRIDGNGFLQTYKYSDDGLKFVESAINDHRLGGTVTKHQLYKDAKGGSSESTEIEITADQKIVGRVLRGECVTNFYRAALYFQASRIAVNASQIFDRPVRPPRKPRRRVQDGGAYADDVGAQASSPLSSATL